MEFLQRNRITESLSNKLKGYCAIYYSESLLHNDLMSVGFHFAEKLSSVKAKADKPC